MVRFPMSALTLAGIQSSTVALFAGAVLLAGNSLPSVLGAPAFWAAVAWLILAAPSSFATGAQNLGGKRQGLR